MLAPPPSNSTSSISFPGSTPNGPRFNPITGTVEQTSSSSIIDVDEMTEEEKELEAEKLFVLFDRLERAGGSPNPVRAAMRKDSEVNI